MGVVGTGWVSFWWFVGGVSDFLAKGIAQIERERERERERKKETKNKGNILMT